jgi:hypothetical protein
METKQPIQTDAAQFERMNDTLRRMHATKPTPHKPKDAAPENKPASKPSRARKRASAKIV